MKMIKQTLGLNVEDSKYYIKLIIEAILIGLFSGLGIKASATKRWTLHLETTKYPSELSMPRKTLLVILSII
jgi:hypothetical protein